MSLPLPMLPPITGIPLLPLIPYIEPTIVYHYTSLETLLKIVETRQLWATSIEYLNDTAERTLFLSRATARLGTYLDEHKDVDRNAFDAFFQDDSDGSQLLTHLPAITSFSRADDSLPQWRAYTPSGSGVCIGIDVSCLKHARVQGDLEAKKHWLYLAPSITFNRVEYLGRFSNAQIDEGIRLAYEKAKQTEAEVLATVDEQGGPTIDQFFRSNLEDSATFYKDASFGSEDEFRLVVGRLYWHWSLLHFRANKSSMVPYLKLDIPNLDGSYFETKENQSQPTTPWNALKRVVIGPTADKWLTARAVHAFFLSKSMNVDVGTTNISFRDW